MTVEAGLVGGRIMVKGWAGPRTADKAKAAGGHYEGKKAWWFKLDLAVCRALRAQFGDDLKIRPALNRWAAAQIRGETALTQFSLQADADLRHVPTQAPRMHEAMSTRTYQRVAAAWGREVGSFLLADQQGLGKSIETLATIIESAPDSGETQWHLVMAPSVAVETVWSAEVLRWLDRNHIRVLPLTGTLAQREERLAEERDPLNLARAEDNDIRHVFVVVNLESARIKPSYDDRKDPEHKRPKYLAKDAVLPALHSIMWDTVIVDECQRALIRTSGKLNQTNAGFKLLSKNSHRRIALSGTPMRGKPEQLWGTLNWLRPDVYTSKWKWIDLYFNRKSNGFSNYLLDGFQPGGEERMAKDLRTIMLRRTKAEVLPELPAKQYAGTYMDPTDLGSPLGIWLDPLPKQRKQLADLATDGLLDFGEEGEMMADGIAVYTRQKQLANAVHERRNGVLVPTLESPKYAWILDWLAEADGEKVIIASWSTSLIDVWAEGLRAEGYDVVTLTGKTSAAKRKAMVAAFQGEDGPQVFMLNKQAGGVALTLDAADYVIFVDEETVPDVDEQVEDRAHRTSRIHNVTIYKLRCLGTQDEEIAWVAAARRNVQDYLLDGARGVESARALYHSTKGK